MSRIFMNFGEAVDEIRRDLKEMGVEVRPKSYQNKNIEGNPDYYTQELTNYSYTVLNPVESLNQLKNTEPWCNLEADERFSGNRINPGEAYKTREEVWNEFLVNGKFDYSYPQRFNPLVNEEGYEGYTSDNTNPLPEDIEIHVNEIDAIQEIADELAKNPDSRQCFIPIFAPDDLINLGGRKRIPCSLGYTLQIREGQLNITYMMRSSDFATHFQNDVWLAVKLAIEVRRRIEEINGIKYPIGEFTHFINSLHIYAKDVKNVF